jgi:hypothetical protein
MGMVFASRRTWVDPEHLHLILQDDEYRLLPGPDQVREGDVLVYRDVQGNVAHVGIVARVNVDLREATRHITILSQWGAAGEYFHQANDVSPYLGTPAEYWSDRK